MSLRILGELAADDAAVLVLLEGLELVRGDVQLVQDGEDRVGVDAELGERHRLVVVLAAVPVERRGRDDAVELGDLARRRQIGTMPANPLAFIVTIRL